MNMIYSSMPHLTSDSKASKGSVAAKVSKNPHTTKAGKGSKVIEIIVSDGRDEKSHCTFKIELGP